MMNGKKSSTEKVRTMLEKRNQRIIAILSIALAVITSIVLIGVKYGELRTKLEIISDENEGYEKSIEGLRLEMRGLEEANEKDHRQIAQSLSKIEVSIEVLKEQNETNRRFFAERKITNVRRRTDKAN